MSFKTVLVHVDAGERSAARVEIAARIASAHGALVAGMYLVPGDEMPPSVAALLPPDVVRMAMQRALDAQHAAGERARRAASAAAPGVAFEWRAPAGEPIEAGVVHGRCSDLIVLGQTEEGDADRRFGDELVSAMILSTGRPVLVVPYTGARGSIGDHVLVAWDGGREAARAIGDAMPLLTRAAQVTVMAARSGDGERTLDDAALAQLVAYLRSHGVTAGVSVEGDAQIGVGERLLSRAADVGADLIVMGGYAHARLRTLVMGGVTRTMLEAMTVPVLMSH